MGIVLGCRSASLASCFLQRGPGARMNPKTGTARPAGTQPRRQQRLTAPRTRPPRPVQQEPGCHRPVQHRDLHHLAARPGPELAGDHHPPPGPLTAPDPPPTPGPARHRRPAASLNGGPAPPMTRSRNARYRSPNTRSDRTPAAAVAPRSHPARTPAAAGPAPLVRAHTALAHPAQWAYKTGRAGRESLSTG